MSGAASPPFLIRLPAYDGPLDLLLDLVRGQEVRIEDVSVSLVASQFLAYVEQAPQIDINLSAEWIGMAARLIFWKSRSLLSQDPELVKGMPYISAEFIELLQKHAREAVEALSRKKEWEDASFSRTEIGAIPAAGAVDEVFFSLWDLIRLCEDHARDSKKAAPYSVGEEEVSVEGMIGWIRGRLETAPSHSIPADTLFSERPRRTEKICTFLGMLELAREQAIELTQTGQLAEFAPFAPILLSRPNLNEE
jgi:segregation and condensation protein A